MLSNTLITPVEFPFSCWEGTSPMPAYYFHVHAEGDFFADDEGCMLDSMEEAVAHAWRIIDYLTAMSEHDWEWRRWSIEVITQDESALIVLFPPEGNVRKSWSNNKGLRLPLPR